MASKKNLTGKNKADLIDAVYKRHGALTKKEAASVVEAVFATMKSTLLEGRTVSIRNFGVFDVQERTGRDGVNPTSGEPIFIPERLSLSFRPSQKLKKVVDESDEVDG